MEEYTLENLENLKKQLIESCSKTVTLINENPEFTQFLIDNFADLSTEIHELVEACKDMIYCFED